MHRTLPTTGVSAVLLALVALLPSCTSESAPAPGARGGGLGAVRSGPLVVVATVEVNRYLAARIGGDLVEVVFPVPPDADPLLWEPDRDAIATLQSADLVLLHGAGLERWRDRVSLAPSRTEVLADAYRDEWLTFGTTVEHQHGPEGEHSHSGTDPHTWMDPELVARHAERITAALIRLLPEHDTALSARGLSVLNDLADLERRWAGIFDGDAPPLLANHPAYDYAAARFGWSVTSLDLDPESLPEGGLALPDLEPMPRVMLWESEPACAVAAAVEAAGLVPVVVSPCEVPPETGDWLSVMRENAERLAGAFSGD